MKFVKSQLLLTNFKTSLICYRVEIFLKLELLNFLKQEAAPGKTIYGTFLSCLIASKPK